MNPVTREILAPMLARVGTALTGYLVGTGAASDLSEKVAVGAVAAVLIGADLLMGHFFRKVGK